MDAIRHVCGQWTDGQNMQDKLNNVTELRHVPVASSICQLCFVEEEEASIYAGTKLSSTRVDLVGHSSVQTNKARQKAGFIKLRRKRKFVICPNVVFVFRVSLLLCWICVRRGVVVLLCPTAFGGFRGLLSLSYHFSPRSTLTPSPSTLCSPLPQFFLVALAFLVFFFPYPHILTILLPIPLSSTHLHSTFSVFVVRVSFWQSIITSSLPPYSSKKKAYNTIHFPYIFDNFLGLPANTTTPFPSKNIFFPPAFGIRNHHFTYTYATMPKKKTIDVEPETPFHTFTVDQVAEYYTTNTLEGLTAAEAANRLKVYGPNELQGNGGVKWYKVLWRQVANALVVILLIATVRLDCFFIIIFC